MDTTSEAACLLDHGQAFRRRAGLRDESGALVFAGFKPGAFSLYFGDLPYYHFDLEGRWQRALIGGLHYLKALDASAESIDRVRDATGSLVLKRRALPFAEARDLDDAIRTAALDLIAGLDSGRLRLEPPPAPAEPIGLDTLREALERIAAWDDAAWFRQREAYLGTYGPLPFLPPSCPSPIILQAALGHASGRAFGGAEPAEPYLRSPAEFDDHAREVARLLGRRAALARGVVLGGPDLLRRPAGAIAPYCETAARVFPITEGPRPRLSDRPDDAPLLDGLYAFLDDLAPPHPDRDGWSLLRSLLLRRVDLGVESALPDIRARFGRTWTDDDLRSLVADLQSAGLGIGLVLLVGAGGESYFAREADAAASLVESLRLGRDDHLYLLDAAEVRGSAGTALLRELGTEPAGIEAIAVLRKRLAPIGRASGLKVVPYTLQKQ
jgi:hypothetical protein